MAATQPCGSNSDPLRPKHTIQHKEELCTQCAADVGFWSSLQEQSSVIRKTRLPADNHCPMCSFLAGALRASYSHWTLSQFQDRVSEYRLFRPFVHHADKPDIQKNIVIYGISRHRGDNFRLSPYRTGLRLLDPKSVAFDVLRGWMNVCQEQHSSGCHLLPHFDHRASQSTCHRL